MPCPVCGDICRCFSESKLTIVQSAESQEGAAEAECNPEQPQSQDSAQWRQEIAARLNRYQSRRKPRPPRYPSLRLQFEDTASSAWSAASEERPSFTGSSHSALALDQFAASANLITSSPPDAPRHVGNDSAARPSEVASDFSESALPPSPKIIEFPRSWAPPLRPADELAEPVVSAAPRILEVPEFVPPAPALGGITIEPAKQAELERRPGIDFPLRSASLTRRIVAAGIDGVIVSGACIVFASVFWKLTAIRPPRLQVLEIASGLVLLFWAAYQYLLIVFSGATPGLRMAGLQLCRFNGSPVNRRLRRWRVLASLLSAVSLGMGFAWVFLDEDALCWHDRITHTYLAPKPPQKKRPET